MAAASASTLSMKLLIDRKAKRLLFAEASKGAVDFLFSLLLMPVGTAVKLLGKEDMVGCIGNLYGSVEELLVLSSNSSLLRQPTRTSSLYRCTSIFNCSCRTYITDAYGKACPTCGNQMTAAAQYIPPAAETNKGFVQEGVATYTVMDDLTIAPMSAISSITLLNTLAVTDIAALHEKTVQLGYNEGLQILRASLWSKTVLTDVFLCDKAPSTDI